MPLEGFLFKKQSIMLFGVSMVASYDDVGVNKERFILFWTGEYKKRKFIFENTERICLFRNAYETLESVVKELFPGVYDEIIKVDSFLDRFFTIRSAEMFGISVEVDALFDIAADAMRKIIVQHPELKRVVDEITAASFAWNLCPSFLLGGVNSLEILMKCAGGVEAWDVPPTIYSDGRCVFIPDSSVKVSLNVQDVDEGYAEIEREIMQAYEAKEGKVNLFRELVRAGPRVQYDIEIKTSIFDSSFDIDLVFEKLCEQLVWAVYDVKRQRSIPLTEGEQALLDVSFQRRVVGSAGPTHAVGRAVGLWLWDYLQEHPSEKRTSAYEALDTLGLNIPYRFEKNNPSIRKTLDRLFNRTNECIEEGRVLPIRGGTGK